MTSREIRTRRLLLRPFQAEDADAFAAFGSEPGYRRYLGPHHPSPAQFIASNLNVDWEREHSWVVCLDRAPVGSIFLGVDQLDRFAELACMLAPSVWRNRIASEAGAAVIAYAFETLRLEKVVARAAEGNVASRRAMDKAGMVQEGLLRSHRIGHDGSRVDEVLYGLTVEDWRRLRHARSER